MEADRDRLLDTLLWEVVGGEEPPDLTAKVLARVPSHERRGRPWAIAVAARRWSKPVAAAAAICAVAVVAWWLLGRGERLPLELHRPQARPDTRERLPLELLEAQVQLSPVARYEVLGPRRLRLDEGEVLVHVEPAEEQFVVETPAGEATALGTRFYVRTYAMKEEAMKGSRFVTAVVVLSGVVQLANLQGVETARPGEVLSAEETAAPKKQAVEDNTAFALDLYAQLKKQEGNLFFSPYSISTALAMTYAGARGNTATQMAEVMHFGLEPEVLHRAFGQLVDDLNKQGEEGGFELSVANALWGQKGYGFLKEFLDLTRDSYGAGLREVDFEGATEAARKTINAWVEKETKEKIKDLIPEGVLDKLTRLVLTNAVYFKADWVHQFEKHATRDRKFWIAAEETIHVPMMHQTNSFGYAAVHGCQLLEMPYKGGRQSMVVLLPTMRDGLGRLGWMAEIEKGLSADKLASWLKQIRYQQVTVILPKFTMTSEFRLDETLKSMGMTDAFSLPPADFSGMNGKNDPVEGLFIGAVLHKAFVEVNEEGTEAAAATAVEMTLGMSSGPSRPIFRADHPFLFLIRDNRTGSILFMGRVAEPRRAEPEVIPVADPQRADPEVIPMEADVACLSNLRNICLGMAMYQTDYADQYPETLQDVFQYMPVPKVFICPNDPKPMVIPDSFKHRKRFPDGGLKCSYHYVGRLSPETDERVILIYENTGNHVYEKDDNLHVRNVVVADLHAETLPEDEFQARLRQSLKLVKQADWDSYSPERQAEIEAFYQDRPLR